MWTSQRKPIIIILILFSQINCFAYDIYATYGHSYEIGANYSQLYGAGVLNELWNRHAGNYLGRPLQDDITFGSQFYGGFYSMTWKYFKFNIELGAGPVTRDSPQAYFEGIRSLGGYVDEYMYEPHHIFEAGIGLLGRFPLLYSEGYSYELTPLAGIAYKIPDYRAVHLQGGLGIYFKWVYLEGLYGLRIGGFYPIDHFERGDTEKIVRTWLDRISLHGFTLKIGISLLKGSSGWNESFSVGNTSYGDRGGAPALRGD